MLIFGFARTACDFIISDLNRTNEESDEVCFSYSRHWIQTRVFNASLLAAETLATVGALTVEESLCDLGRAAQRDSWLRRQRENGSWAYGEDGRQSWCDNFHTAFVLTSLSRISTALRNTSLNSTDEIQPALARVMNSGASDFFSAIGGPSIIPIDCIQPTFTQLRVLSSL
jgi:hypothetical protein